MAELALKIGTHGQYEDGDIVDAFNRTRIRRVHAEMICHVKHAGRNTYGLRPDGLSRQLREICCQYRFERVSRREVERVEIATDQRQRFASIDWVSEGWLRRQGIAFDGLLRRHNEKLNRPERLYAAFPNSEGEYIDVETYLQHQLRHPQHCVFGSRGKEVWYGGLEDKSDAKLDLVWQEIERRTPLREVDHRLWPMGLEECKTHLFISVDDFDGSTLCELFAPVYEDGGGEPELTIRRRYTVAWRESLELTTRQITDVEDRKKKIDIRADRQYWRAEVVRDKHAIDLQPEVGDTQAIIA